MSTTKEHAMETVTAPSIDQTDGTNWAEATTEAWIDANGGRDVTEVHMTAADEADGNYAGHVEVDGTVYRLHVDPATRLVVVAEAD